MSAGNSHVFRISQNYADFPTIFRTEWISHTKIYALSKFDMNIYRVH